MLENDMTLKGAFPFSFVIAEGAWELRILAALIALVLQEVTLLSVSPATCAHVALLSFNLQH